ncbi:DUF6092 family protein [Tepidimicrobium xylanilyticum]|uniref:DUF6092 family protein n=1 Tax=Tepidimicrobium xylanilyticum TaxID=1123352 RepID=UPI00115FC8F4|nr:DUF6092 family protein [Tepidimicrobium xylanilyticum]
MKVGDYLVEVLLPKSVIDELDKAVCYILTSAKSYVDEPRSYVPMRLLESASIILDILSIYDNKYLWLNEEINRIKLLPLESEAEYLREIDIILTRLIESY